MQFKDNYFGDFTKISKDRATLDSHALKTYEIKNDFDFSMGLRIQELTANLPENLYDNQNCITLQTSVFEVDLRYRPAMLGMITCFDH